MNFNKKAIGSSIDRDYVWISTRRKHKFVIHLDKENYTYWFDVTKDGKTVYDSLADNVKYTTAEEAFTTVETWADINICGKTIKKPRFTVDSKYNVLVNAVKNICENYENFEATNELKSVLARIGEA